MPVTCVFVTCCIRVPVSLSILSLMGTAVLGLFPLFAIMREAAVRISVDTFSFLLDTCLGVAGLLGHKQVAGETTSSQSVAKFTLCVGWSFFLLHSQAALCRICSLQSVLSQLCSAGPCQQRTLEEPCRREKLLFLALFLSSCQQVASQ